MPSIINATTTSGLTTSADNSGSLQLATNNGTTAVTIDTSQNVGIGTSSPAVRLDVGYTGGNVALRIQRDASNRLDFYQGGGVSYIDSSPASAQLAFATVGTERMRIDSSGNVGIGTNSPTSFLSGTFGAVIRGNVPSITLSGTETNGKVFNIYETGGNLAIYDASAGVDRMRITSGGELLVGTTSNIGVGAKVAFLSAGNVLHIQSSSSGANNLVSYDSGGTARFSVSNGGAVSKTSGSFKIDHPLSEKSETHHLVHSFVEAPQADNIYRGKTSLVNGKAEVNIDLNSGMTEGTFVALNREVQCFTSNETDWDAVRGFVNGNILTIECQNQSSTATISWLVIGERQDKHMYETDWTDENGKVIVEPLKALVEQQSARIAELEGAK